MERTVAQTVMQYPRGRLAEYPRRTLRLCARRGPYDLPKASDVALAIYTITGQEVARVMSGHREAGHYEMAWDGRDYTGRDVASGVYLCRMVADDYVAVRKMVLVR